MRIDQLAVGANKDLYDSLSKHYKIILEKSADDSWGCNVVGTDATIWYAPTKHPEAAFAHELLHVLTQSRGYKRIRAAISMDVAVNQYFKEGRWGEAIDNEFQHHKMFDEFKTMGYSDAEFYNDADAAAYDKLKKILTIPGEPLHHLGKHYLSVIAPGGTFTAEQKDELRASFDSYDNEKYKGTFAAIEDVMNRWKGAASFDAEPYIVEYLQILDADTVWMAYGSPKEFPKNGFFSGRHFTVEELIAAHKSAS